MSLSFKKVYSRISQLPYISSSLGPSSARPHQRMKSLPSLTRDNCDPHASSPSMVCSLDFRQYKGTSRKESRQTHSRRKVQPWVSKIQRVSRAELSVPADRSYPEIVTSSGPDLMSITNRIRHESRPKIPGKVESITSLKPKTGTQPKN